MTINIADNSPRANYTATSGQTVFTVSFEFFDEADLTVYINGTETSSYTVTGGDGSTGTVTLTSGATAGDKIAIVRDVAIERTTDFTEGAAISRSALNEQLDKLTAQVADINDRASRSLQLNDHEVAASTSLPATDDRKGKVLGFNEVTGDVQSGPLLTDVQSLADVSADIATLADIEDGTDATDAIQTAASISSDITTVSGISSNVTTVAGISSDVTAVAADATDIGTVATNISSVNTVATNIADVITVANDLNEAVSEVVTVADDLNEAVSEIDTVAGSITNVNTVGTNIADVNTVAGISANVTTVAGISANTTTVAGISGNVTTVAGISSDVTAVAADATDIGTVATSISNVNAVAGNATNINAVAGNATNINTVASDSVNIGTVAGISANVSTVAGLSSSVSTLALISSDITTVAGISANVTTVAGDTANIATIATNLNGTNTIGTVAGSISNVNSVGGAIADVSTVASNLTDVQAFANTYRIGATDPTTSLDEGDLFYNTTSNTLKVYTGSAWEQGVTAGSGFLPLTGGGLTGNLTFGDNDKAIFGAGSDLQIFHDNDGSTEGSIGSYIKEGGTGDLRIRASNLQLQTALGERYLTGEENSATTIFYDNAAKLATTSTGIDVTGTVTADGLTVSSSGTANSLTLTKTDGNATKLVAGNTEGTHTFEFNNGGMFLSDTTGLRLGLNSGGDISFYEDTGTTPKFFWDASAESLGIGTTSVDLTASGRTVVQVEGSSNALVNITDGTSRLYLHQKGGTNGADIWNSANSYMRFATNDTERMRIDSSGNVGIGTSSPLALLDIASGVNTTQVRIRNTSTGTASMLFQDSTSGTTTGDGLYVGRSTGVNYLWTYESEPLVLATNNTERMRIDASGNVGIGTSSPANTIHMFNSTNSGVRFQNTSTGSGASDGSYVGNVFNSSDFLIQNGETAALLFKTANTERMRIDSSGNVDIGSTGGGVKLAVAGAVGPQNGSAASPTHTFYSDTNTGMFRATVDTLGFSTAGSERMRIDSSGNLLVGTTTTYPAGSGVSGAFIESQGRIEASRASAPAIRANRNTTDGDIMEFRKDGTTVGSIGTTSGTLLIDSGTAYSGLGFDQYVIYPRNSGATSDNLINLGYSNYRFKDAYFSGTVNAANFNTTSDATLKTNVETLTGSLDAVKALRGVSFDWIENGNSEVGVIAQEVEAVVPDVVSTNDQGIKSVKYGNLVGVLIEAIKEQQAQIDELKAKLGD